MIRAAIVISLLASTAIPATASLSIEPKLDALNKINLSGRQRMLSQRISKATCFAKLDVNQEQHLKMAQDAVDLFEHTLDALHNGNPEMSISGEGDAEILAELLKVESLWAETAPALDGIENGVTDEAMKRIVRPISRC